MVELYKFDLVIMDVKMLCWDGIDVVFEIVSKCIVLIVVLIVFS